MYNRFDPLTDRDKKILLYLYKNHRVLIPTLAKDCEIEPKRIYYNLKKLQKMGWCQLINSKPKLVKFTGHAAPFVWWVTVQCPKCHFERKVDNNQILVNCGNRYCETKSGKQTRFYVTKQRIVESERFNFRKKKK